MRLGRWFLIASIVVVLSMLLLIAGCAEEVTPTAAPAATEAPEATEAPTAFDGITLNTSMLEWPPTTALKAITPEFEQMTGAKVTYDILPWEPSHEKLLLELGAGNPTYDVITLDAVWTSELIRGGHLEPLPVNEWKADASFDFDDIFASYLRYFNEPYGEGQTYVMPFASDVPALLYRTDLFNDPKEQEAFKAQYGYDLKPPATWDEYLDVAKFFTRDDMYGTAIMAGRGFPIASDFTMYMYGRGGDMLDEKVRPIFNSPEGVAALEFYASLYNEHKVVDPESINWAFDEVIGAMQTGRIAMAILWVSFMVPIDNPELSQVAGKVDIAPMPRLPEMAGQKPPLGGWGIAVPKYSKNKEAAIAYVKWFLEKETQKQYALAGGPPGRASTFFDDDVVAKYFYFRTFAEGIKASYPVVWPVVPVYTEMQNIIGIEAQKALLGEQSAKEALDKAVTQVTDLLKRSGYLEE